MKIKEDDISFDIKKVFLKNVIIKHANVDFIDQSTLLFSTAKDLNIHVKAADMPEKMILYFESNISNLLFQYNGITYIKNLRTSLHSDIFFNKKERLPTF